MKNRILLLAVIFFCAENAHGQFIATINPANTGDPRFIFANPAIPDSGAPFIVVGYQRLFSGLPLLSNSIIGLVLPTARWGSFALVAPGFQSPHFNQSALELRYAYVFDNLRTAIGFNAGTMMTSYNRKKYHLVDAYDPLLLGNQSLNVFNLGLGATVKPIDKLTIGLSADHLNRPHTSFQGGMRRKVHLQAGVMAELGSFRPMAMWEQDEGQTYYSFGGEFWFRNVPLLDGLMARAFLGSEQLSLGAGLLYKNIRLDYLFDYPMSDLSIIAGASHQFIATYTFEKQTCSEPPYAYARALQDTLQRWLSDEQLRESCSADIQWQTINSFFVNGQAYEILNPQANPFANYVFFEQGRDELAEGLGDVKKLAKLYVDNYMQRGAKIVLRGYINGGLDGACDNCEQDPDLAKRRVKAVQDSLKGLGVPDTLIADNTAKVRRFLHCIEQEMILKSERQRVQVSIEHDGARARLPLLFTKKMQSDELCTFDLSVSQAPCGWKSWILGLWSIDDEDNLKLLWSSYGRGEPKRLISWDWKASLAKYGPMSRTVKYKLSVRDKNNSSAISETDSLHVHQLYRPTSLLVLYNFDRYSEILGEGVNPEDNPETNPSLNGSCEALKELDTQTARLLESSLDPVIAAAQAGQISIQGIIGHTDDVGDEEHNVNLSYARALAVKCFLEDHGVDVPDVVEGRGESEPLTSNLTPAGRWLNRRVEIVIHYK